MSQAIHILSRESSSLSEAAYSRIRSMIITLELEPGSLISESALMSTLKMGRTPIREALRSLANEKLVEVYPRRGMFVSRVDVANLSQLSETRAVLEIKAAELAATRSTPADQEITKALIKEINAIKGDLDMPTLIGLDQRIHHHIYQCTHNEFLASALDNYYAHALRIWFLALDRVEHLADAIIEHRALLEAIASNDPKAASKAMKEHVEGFESEIRKSL
ncbi:GntR family transcriptional regulator [Candidatus Planktophila vernalis]|uniref:GntR family transcriptional regulator n=1 Tax=Candidatus Planktophila vernalis TaxID=1884907 RepID=UPI003CF457D5